MKGLACSMRFMATFRRLINEGKTIEELIDIYCMSKQEIYALKRALVLEDKLKSKINFTLQPTHLMKLAQVKEEDALDLAVREVEKAINHNKEIGKKLRHSPITVKQVESIAMRVNCAYANKLKEAEEIDHIETHGSSEEWSKERLLHFLANRLYNTVTWRTELPYDLLKLPQIRRECEFYLTALNLLKTPEEEIQEFLGEEHKKWLLEVEQHNRQIERRDQFIRTFDELRKKLKQITIEFEDGPTIKLEPSEVPRLLEELLEICAIKQLGVYEFRGSFDPNFWVWRQFSKLSEVGV